MWVVPVWWGCLVLLESAPKVWWVPKAWLALPVLPVLLVRQLQEERYPQDLGRCRHAQGDPSRT